MSMKDRLANKAASLGTHQRERAPRDEANRGPKTAPGQLMASIPYLREKEEEIEALQAKLKEVATSQPLHTVQLSELHEVAGRRRNLTAEQFSELVENLKYNDLITPITVRPRPEGGYEIVSGHNRVAAYRELGRPEIEAVVRSLDEERAVLGAFYANLLQPQLPDYEKFLGFVAIRGISPELTPDELADKAGISRAQVYRLMAFGDLPPEALAMIAKHPECVGSTAVFELAKQSKNGKADAVVLAVEKLARKEVTQDEALRLVSGVSDKPREAAKLEKPKPISIRSGKEKFLTIRPTGVPTAFKLEFESVDAAQETMTAFQEWLKERIAARKPGE
jgi:ParB family chromosome partitioning protein